MISNCGHDERGGYSGGKAGDQTGTEWYIRSWYNHNWNCVIRFSENVREQLALNAERAAKNNLIGYDQNERLSYYNHLKASNWNASKITVACEADCSAGVSANIIAAGYILGIDKLKSFNKSNTTRSLKNACKTVGATILTESKYLTSDAYLLRGDLILKEGSHVTTNLTNGSKVSSNSNQVSNVSHTNNSPKNNSLNGNEIIKQGQIHANNFAQCGLVADGIRGTNTKKAAVKVVQRALNADYNAGITEDGVWGNATDKAFGNHYVKVSETQYLVTALEIICMLKGKNPNGVECPGNFGNGLASACGTTKAYKDTFKALVS